MHVTVGPPAAIKSGFYCALLSAGDGPRGTPSSRRPYRPICIFLRLFALLETPSSPVSGK
jgi:hypothetical protein